MQDSHSKYLALYYNTKLDGTDDGTISAGFAASLQVGWNEVGVTHSLAKNGVGTDTVKLYANGASQNHCIR